MPSAPDVALAPVTAPLPLATANVTAVPATAFPYWSFTITAGAVATATPTFADWLSPLAALSDAAAPAVPVAVKRTAVSPLTVASTVFVPAIVPSVHVPALAAPAA